MKIQESAENYLETILMLKEERGMVRSIDIVRHHEFFQTQRQPRYESAARKRIYLHGQRGLY